MVNVYDINSRLRKTFPGLSFIKSEKTGISEVTLMR